MPLTMDEQIQLIALTRILDNKDPKDIPVRILEKLVEDRALLAPDDLRRHWALGPKAANYLSFLRSRHTGRDPELDL